MNFAEKAQPKTIIKLFFFYETCKTLLFLIVQHLLNVQMLQKLTGVCQFDLKATSILHPQCIENQLFFHAQIAFCFLNN